MSEICKADNWDDDPVEDGFLEDIKIVFPILVSLVILALFFILCYNKRRNCGSDDSVGETVRRPLQFAMPSLHVDNTGDGEQDQNTLSHQTPPTQSISYISDVHQPLSAAHTDMPTTLPHSQAARPPPGYEEALNCPLIEQGLPTYKDALDNEMEKK